MPYGTVDSGMNELERQVMAMLLQGDHSVLEILRRQLAKAEVLQREFTGVGFFVHFRVPDDVLRIHATPRLILSDVHAEVQGLQYGAGFVLFTKDGAIDMLEGSSYQEPWPKDAKLTRVFYMNPKTPGDSGLIETTERDLEYALARLFQKDQE